MRLLVLGKNGQVGWALARALSLHGDVVCLGRDQADLEDSAQLRNAVNDTSPDVIINAAAYTAVDRAEAEPEQADRVNHRAVSELAEIAAKRGSWLVHYSTDYVFDGKKLGPYVETDETAPQSVYGQSKLDGEKVLALSAAKHLIFRTSWVHAGRGHNFVRTMLRLAIERERLRVVSDQIGAPTSADLIADITAHAVAAIRRGAPPPSGVYHLAAAGATSWNGLARFAIGEAPAWGLVPKVTPDKVDRITTADYPTAATRPANSRLDTTKLRETLGVTLPPWELHVRRSVAELLEGRVSDRVVESAK